VVEETPRIFRKDLTVKTNDFRDMRPTVLFMNWLVKQSYWKVWWMLVTLWLMLHS